MFNTHTHTLPYPGRAPVSIRGEGWVGWWGRGVGGRGEDTVFLIEAVSGNRLDKLLENLEKFMIGGKKGLPKRKTFKYKLFEHFPNLIKAVSRNRLDKLSTDFQNLINPVSGTRVPETGFRNLVSRSASSRWLGMLTKFCCEHRQKRQKPLTCGHI